MSDHPIPLLLPAYKPNVKIEIPCKQIRIGDFYKGAEVLEIHQDRSMVYFYIAGGKNPQAFRPDFYIEVERKGI